MPLQSGQPDERWVGIHVSLQLRQSLGANVHGGLPFLHPSDEMDVDVGSGIHISQRNQ